MEPLRDCPRCKVPKPLSEYDMDPRRPGKPAGMCKECRRARTKAYNQTEAGKVSLRKAAARQAANTPNYGTLQQVAYADNNPERCIWRRARSTANRKGLDFDLDLSDIVIPALCPILKVPLVRRGRYAPSIDRIRSTRGYVKGNVVIISRLANTMKAHATFLELATFCENAAKFYLPLMGN